MIKIGEYQELTIAREMPQGLYLEDEEGYEVLMPGPFITEDMKVDDKLTVFVYCDSSDREIASTEKPMMIVNEFAYLEVTAVTEHGAFCDWGVSKELFLPFSNQAQRVRSGQKYVVHMYLDEVSERLVGTTKLNPFLYNEADEDDFKMGEQVKLLVYAETDLGYKVIINQSYIGLVYKNEVHKPLRIGEKTKGYIKPIRSDKKIDVSLYPIGHQSIEPNAQLILDKLVKNEGYLAFTDKSDPDSIRKEFGISKKLFKKALGALYKQKLVLLKPDGIYKV